MTTTTTTGKTWSAEQDIIFDWFATGRIPTNLAGIAASSNNAVVVAFAGCGKTTTIVEGVNRAPETSIALCAYNKKIAEELSARVSNPNVTVKTLHALGLAAIKRFRDNIRVSFKKEDRADKLTAAVCGMNAPDAVTKLVTKLHTLGREIAPHATQLGELTNIQIAHECEPDEQWTASGFDASYVEQKALEAMALAANVKSGDTIDGSDMIFLPVRNGWLQKTYDLVVVDEAQDMTVAQLEIAQGLCRGRICVVGDPNQAIYGFRGADSDSISRLKTELNAVEFSLSTTYRCGRAIVENAQRFVPKFTAGPNNAEGKIEYINASELTKTADLSDFILSRLNAPLVSIAMSLLRSGKRTRIAGRDIGAGLLSLIRKFKARSVADFLTKVASWENREVLKLEKMLEKSTNGRRATIQTKIEALKDQAEMLMSLADNASSVNNIIERVEALFTDDGLGQAGVITCSSVHRSKGLEANRVFVLADTLRANNQEELNIQYVAVTRAKSTLVFVHKDTN